MGRYSHHDGHAPLCAGAILYFARKPSSEFAFCTLEMRDIPSDRGIASVLMFIFAVPRRCPLNNRSLQTRTMMPTSPRSLPPAFRSLPRLIGASSGAAASRATSRTPGRRCRSATGRSSPRPRAGCDPHPHACPRPPGSAGRRDGARGEERERERGGGQAWQCHRTYALFPYSMPPSLLENIREYLY